MIFTDLRFFLCFGLCWVTFVAVPRAWRATALAVWGTVFYALFAASYLPLVFVLVAATYAASGRILRWVAGLAIAGTLIWFKWQAGFGAGVPGASTGSVLIPLGLSFLAFELLHVIAERGRGRLPDLAPMDLLAFAFFLPARVAGPIKRYRPFLDSVRDAQPSVEEVYGGGLRVLLGLAKKVLVADVLALTVAQQGYASSSLQVWYVVLAYSFQILLDFSAYSDIAIGFARMLGIKLPENFNWPYLAVNIREFWNRWHMTLSEWVREYIFMPTGRVLFRTNLRRAPAVIATLSYLVTFLIVGAWHGMTLSFIVWGLYHGVLLSVHHVVKTKLPNAIARHPLYQAKATAVASAAFTFLCVSVGWVPFMTDMDRAAELLRLMFGLP